MLYSLKLNLKPAICYLCCSFSANVRLHPPNPTLYLCWLPPTPAPGR